jgi:hypothetical protein
MLCFILTRFHRLLTLFIYEPKEPGLLFFVIAVTSSNTTTVWHHWMGLEEQEKYEQHRYYILKVIFIYFKLPAVLSSTHAPKRTLMTLKGRNYEKHILKFTHKCFQNLRHLDFASCIYLFVSYTLRLKINTVVYILF